jgi:uncharacterized membrane protein YcaP (DUF421 family)
VTDATPFVKSNGCDCHASRRLTRYPHLPIVAGMWTLGTSPIELVFRAIVIYAAFFTALRLFGKREIGQFTLFDLALVLLGANALQPAMTGPDSSLAGGLVLILTLFAIDRSVAFLRVRVPIVGRILEFGPTVVGRDGRWNLREMVREGLDLVDVEAALREHGLDDVGQMKLAVLEADGSISIVGDDEGENARTRRRRRYRRRTP